MARYISNMHSVISLTALTLLCTHNPSSQAAGQSLISFIPFENSIDQRRIKLGVNGSRFTLNGKTEFLLGISYYGALGASDKIVNRDLATIRQKGFNWIRVWATWDAYENDISAVDGSG